MEKSFIVHLLFLQIPLKKRPVAWQVHVSHPPRFEWNLIAEVYSATLFSSKIC
jgi:hypothetical protein